MRLLPVLRNRWLLLLWVAGSLLLNLLQFPVLHGTFGGLVLAVLTQVYLPGYLLARRLGRHRLPHPIHRFAWVLACGLSLSIVLGGPFRLFEQSIPVYLVALHGLMLILALLPEGQAPADETPWRWRWRMLPLYATVALCCAIAVGVAYESRYRFYGFEDQPIFISYIDWLAHHPGERPVPEIPLRTRQVGVLSSDSRMDTDGWTYNHAAWSWSSGVGGAQLIWFDLAALFIWCVPLLTFALAYELTRREAMAAYSAIALTFVGLLTLDNLVYAPSYLAYGRFVLFQINVVRQASLTLMLPLALLCGFAYLRTHARRDLLPLALSAGAIALMHPFQFMIVAISLGAVGLARLASAPSWRTFRVLLPVGLILAFILIIPYLQRANWTADRREDVLSVVRPATENNPGSLAQQYFLTLPELPILGQTYIRNPATVFYHPAITLAILLGFLYGLGWRAHPVRQYAFAVTLIALILFFTPGLTRLVDRFISSVGLLTLMFLFPVALIYGQALDDLLAWVRRWSSGQWLASGVPVGAGALMLVLLIEPFPIPASPRDQLNAYNAMQESRRMLPAQAAASQALVAQLPPGQISIIATPSDIANFMIEDTPDALITGGRRTVNRAIAGNNRLFTEGDPVAPWLDTTDLDFLNQWRVTHILATADWTRSAQIQLQAARFEPLGAVGGYVSYRLPAPLTPDSTDSRFARMNELYAALANPRWGREGFNLGRAGVPEVWEPLAAEWRAVLEADPQDDRARLGLAFAQTLAGEDAAALEAWTALLGRYPDMPLYADAVASTRAILNLPDAAEPLLTALESPLDATRVLAARCLLTETFFFRLDADGLMRLLAVTDGDAVTWERLADFDQVEATRARAALLLYRGEYARPAAWLGRLARVRLAPQDLMALAAARLVQGDLDGALAILHPATDPDWVRPNAALHPDRWAVNPAADLYAQLEAGRTLPVESLPETHPLRLLGAESLYAFDPVIASSGDGSSLLVTATFSDYRPRNAYPITAWRVYLVSADGLTEYAQAESPALFPEGPLVRATIQVPLPPDLAVLTAAQVIIEPRHNNAITALPLRRGIVLNRPLAAEPPPDSVLESVRFGDQIDLRAARLTPTEDAIQLDLFWEAESPPPADYQLFIHVLDASGTIVAQRDSGPVDNRYPTSQWLPGVLIADSHRLPLDQPLPPGAYTVRIGLYQLPGGQRLPISGAPDRTQDDSLLIGSFSR
jgi:hypothetical protein